MTDARPTEYSEEQVRHMVVDAVAAAGGVRALSRKWKLSPAYICDLTTGKRRVSATVAQRLCLLLDRAGHQPRHYTPVLANPFPPTE